MLRGGGLVVAGSLLRGSRSAGWGLPGRSILGPEGTYIATDAFPWGLAGLLFESFKSVAWYGTPLMKNDLCRFKKASVESSKHNTTWEALALFLAVRLWLPSARVLPRVRSDSLSGLRSMLRLSNKYADLSVIAQELALDAVLGQYSVGSRLTSQVFPTDCLVVCHECQPLSRTFYHSLLGACHSKRLQMEIVGSGRLPLRSTGAEPLAHTVGASRDSHAVFLVVALLALCSIWSSRSPGPAHATQAHVGAPPARAAW